MPNFSHQRYVVLTILARDHTTNLQNLMRALGIGENFSQAEYLRVHQLMTRLFKAGLVSRDSNPRHGLTLYTITSEGRNTLVALNSKVSQEMNTQLARKKRESTGTPDDAPVRVSPVISSAAVPPSLDVVRCPHCNFSIPANVVRSALRQTGLASCPECQYDLTDSIGGSPVD